MTPQKVDVLLIGGGIVGVCVARELQAAGKSVVLIDKGAIGAGCSYANAGWVTPCFAMPLPQPGMFWKSIGWLLDNTSPLYIKPSLDTHLFRWLWHFTMSMNRKKMLQSIHVLTDISKHSMEFYTALGERNKDVSFEKKGLLMVSSTDDGLRYAKNEMDLMAEKGIAGRYMGRDEVLQFEPILKPLVKGGVFFPDEAQSEPFRTTLAIAEEFKQLGGKILLGTEVFDLTMANGRIEEVVTTQGRFKADLVVLAAGSWSPDLAKILGANIPLLGGKGYSMTLSGGTRKPQRPLMIVERKIAVTPWANSTRIAGTLELVNQDFSISPTRVNAIYTGAQEYMHLDSEGGPKDIWRGLRPCTPDGVPLIGFSKRLSNLFYCAGHQMLGLQSAPGSARLAMELITGKAPYTDPAPFRPQRFE